MLELMTDGKVNGSSHPMLQNLAAQLPEVLAGSKAEATIKRYAAPWAKFKAWTYTVGVAFLPADPIMVALYLMLVMQTCQSMSAVSVASAAIYCMHLLANKPVPTEAQIVRSVRETAKRRLKHSVNKKEPLAWQHVVQTAKIMAQPTNTLAELMTATAISVAFAGFLRYSDLAMIYVDWINFGDGFMEIFLEKSKNDQYREGHWIVFTEVPDSEACPVRLTKMLMSKAFLYCHRPLFSACAQNGDYKRSAIAYTTLRKYMLAAFQRIGLPAASFGTHSCRAGGATLAANLGIPDRLWMEHGGWRSERAARGYVKTSRQGKLIVTQEMFSRFGEIELAPFRELPSAQADL